MEQQQQQQPESNGAETGKTSNGAQPAEQAQASQPFKSFASQDELDKFMADRAKRASRQALNTLARDFGFDDSQEMQEALHAIRKTPAKGDSQDSPQKADRGSDEVGRLRMALTVAGELNLPAALIGRLQGNTVEEMKADAQTMLALLQPGTPAQRATIPPAPVAGQAITFTRAQLQDPAFVRAHKDEILRAGREGRIVNS